MLPPRRTRLILAAGALALTAACTGAPGDETVPRAATGTVDAAGPAASGSATGTVQAGPSPSPSASPSAQPVELPRGGRSIFPEHVVVAYYGTAGTGALGVLGETDPDTAALRTLQAGIPFQSATGRPLLPAFELITTVAQARPGADGDYTSYLPVEEVRRWVEAARRAKMLVILDFQPGRAEFLEQVQRYESVLLEPEVGIALDPEWKLTADQRPLRQIGTSSAKAINDVSSYLANLVVRNGLPEKIFMVHQFKAYQLPDRERIVDRPGLDLVLHVDGFGSRGAKRETYGYLASRDGQFHNGFKLFYDEDVDGRGRSDLMTPAEAAALDPAPELFTYQ